MHLHLARLLVLLSLFATLSFLDGANLPRPLLMEAKSKRKEQLINFFAGGLAGTVASSLTIPLEVVKTQLQSSAIGTKNNAVSICKHIWHREGVKVSEMSFLLGFLLGQTKANPFTITSTPSYYCIALD